MLQLFAPSSPSFFDRIGVFWLCMDSGVLRSRLQNSKFEGPHVAYLGISTNSSGTRPSPALPARVDQLHCPCWGRPRTRDASSGEFWFTGNDTYVEKVRPSPIIQRQEIFQQNSGYCTGVCCYLRLISTPQHSPHLYPPCLHLARSMTAGIVF